jgi:hypothetical protein
MFYHARSNKHVQEGVAFELLQAVTIEVPAVMAPDPNWLPNPEDPDEVAPLIEISPATTREEDQMMQYPANWLNMTTAEEKQAAGLEEVMDLVSGQNDGEETTVRTEELVGATRLITYSPRDPASVTALRQARIKQEITGLEAEQILAFARLTREFMLGWAEMTYTPAQLAQNIGYQRLKAFDQALAAKRSQL